MVRARGYAQRTRSPRSRRKNGIRAGLAAADPWPVRPSRTGSRTEPRGSRTAPQAADRGQGGWYRGAAAGEPRPSGEAVPAGPPRPGTWRRDNPGEAAHHAAPDETEAGVSQPIAPSAPPRRSLPPALPFPELPAVVDLPAIEREVLARWRDGRVFERSLDQTSAGPPWTFYEGPPTANGMPGVHHVEARVFKDLFPRFKTMQGFHVPRQGGWDCHGLPVEVAVEQELGVSGKKEIEAYGIAEFNARCRESVLRHVDAFEELTERMGYWVDLQHAYRTMDPDYIESVWWSLKVVFDEGPADPGLPDQPRTARAARPRCPTTRWASRTCTGRCPTRRSPSASRC